MLAITVALTLFFCAAYMLFRNEVWVSIADDLVFPAACTILGALTIALVGRTTASRFLNRNKNTGGGTETRSACPENCTSTGILIFTFFLLGVSFLTYISYSDQSWGGIVRNFVFPFCYTVIGAVIVARVGISIADEFLDHYNDRVKEGLANRKLFFKGDAKMIESTREDLKYSGLINSENYMSNTTGITESDLVILCVKKTYKEQRVPIRRTITDQPNAENTDSGSTVAEPESESSKIDPCAAMQSMFMARMEDTVEYKKWKDEAHASVEDIMSKVGHDSRMPALIVYTDGWLAPKTRDRIGARPFTALVNTRGRIVSDIHSLLTTLPPRS